MKKVLYITNKEVPYKVKFFNKLSKKCDLTVLFGTANPNNRNEKWAKSVENNFKYYYLSESKVPLMKMISFIFKDYDNIIFGCITDKKQLFLMILMRIFNKRYILNLDGEIFITGNSIKDKLKKFFINGADKYLIAGEKSAESVNKVLTKNKKVIPYYFSSLTEKEICYNSSKKNEMTRIDRYILVIGQYFEYKGLDIALKAAADLIQFKFKFIGMGYRTEEFKKLLEEYEIDNVELIPFLQKEELELEYRTCEMLVLPSRRECWGLVVNEAASFGTPIVSTWGSGAAVEFMAPCYSCFLANPDDYKELKEKIILLDNYKEKNKYSQYLKERAMEYNIEKSVSIHERLFYEEEKSK